MTQFLFLKIIEFHDFVYCGGNKIQTNEDSRMLKKKFPDWKHILFSECSDNFFRVAASIQNHCKTSEKCLITSFIPKLPNVKQELTSSNCISFKTANEKFFLENPYMSFIDFLVRKYTKIKVLAFLFRMLSLYTTIKCEKEQFLVDFLMVQTERIFGNNSSNREKMIYQLNYFLNNENKERLQQLKIDSQSITLTINKFTIKKTNNNINPKNLLIQKQSQKFKQFLQKGIEEIEERDKNFSKTVISNQSKTSFKNLDLSNSQNTKNRRNTSYLEAIDDLNKKNHHKILVNLDYQKNYQQIYKEIKYLDKPNETVSQRLNNDFHLKVPIQDLYLKILSKENQNTELKKTNQLLQNLLKQKMNEDHKKKEILNDLESKFSQIKKIIINTS